MKRISMIILGCFLVLIGTFFVMSCSLPDNTTQWKTTTESRDGKKYNHISPKTSIYLLETSGNPKYTCLFRPWGFGERAVLKGFDRQNDYKLYVPKNTIIRKFELK